MRVVLFSPQAEDLSVRRRTVIQSPAFPSPCQFQAPQLFLAERGGSQFSHLGICSDVTPHGHEIQAEELTKHCNKELPAALELVLNVKSDCFGTETPMPKFLKAATTSLHQCYIAPVCSTS
jgi:hypothetical protein